MAENVKSITYVSEVETQLVNVVTMAVKDDSNHIRSMVFTMGCIGCAIPLMGNHTIFILGLSAITIGTDEAHAKPFTSECDPSLSPGIQENTKKDVSALANSVNGKVHDQLGRTPTMDNIAQMIMDISNARVKPFNLEDASMFGGAAMANSLKKNADCPLVVNTLLATYDVHKSHAHTANDQGAAECWDAMSGNMANNEQRPSLGAKEGEAATTDGTYKACFGVKANLAHLA